MKDYIEELERMCNDFLEDLTECHLEEGKKFIAVEYLTYSGKYEELLDIQTGKAECE